MEAVGAEVGNFKVVRSRREFPGFIPLAECVSSAPVIVNLFVRPIVVTGYMVDGGFARVRESAGLRMLSRSRRN